ncbi:MAG TPA: nicotinate-nucleotide--dimethylbenzimidazole phosphoribosyltransferase [Mycobacteriales bacterium]|nr:nicotinate-nucleotide--dimethylbenzimidazole phosphoribosyltransferase [Mycobacteriales bacterium]
MSRLAAELTRVFGDPPVAPRAVVRVEVGSGQGLDAARLEADRLVDAGADLVVLDSPGAGVGPLTALALLLDLEPVTVVPDEPAEGWRERVLALRALCRAGRPLLDDPAALLEHLQDPALTRTTGLLAQLADRRTPVLCGGGTTTAAAALVAARLAPTTWWLAGSAPVLPAAARAWRALDREPLLDLGLAEGGADVAAAVVRAGLDLLGA